MPALQGYNRHQKENGFNILFKSLQQGIPELQENLQACSVEVPGRTRQISCSSAGFGVRGGSGVGGGRERGGELGEGEVPGVISTQQSGVLKTSSLLRMLLNFEEGEGRFNLCSSR